MRDREKLHSEHVISVQLKKTNQRMKVIGGIPVDVSSSDNKN